MRTRMALAFACFLLGGIVSAETLKSSAPFIYVIDYGDKWIKDPTAAGMFGDTPPDVLHIGKAVPVTHNWGPIPLMAGENQYTGGPTLNRDATRLLTPAELEQKTKDITAAVERLHKAGIKQVMPYICFYSIAGDHESHEGLWKFYDHWDEYAKWMGPKPPESPTEWVTKDAEGKRIETGYGYTPPYYAPLHRYAVCPNNPSWNQFSAAIVKLIAQCGYDGVFVDNSILGGDGCKYCEAAFKKWMGENFDQATLRRACGAQEIGEISLENRNLGILKERWHISVIRDRLAMLRKVGAEIRPGFQTFPNVGHYQWVLALGDGCDLFMFESTKPPGCLAEGEPPADAEALITVSEGAAVSMDTMNYEGMHADVYSEVTAQVRFPRTCPPGQPVEIAVKVIQVGQSNRDDDCMEGLTVRLGNLRSSQWDVVRLGPEPGVGDPGMVPGAKRPPVELKGTWTPRAAGPYAIDLAYKYTDGAHLDGANHTPVSDRLNLKTSYRVNLGGLSCTYNSRCKTISLMVSAKGMPNVEELALAEGAANGGRYAVQSAGEPLKKYWRFFHEHGEKAVGLAPYGSVTLLYSYWGGNPGEVGATTSLTAAEHLSANHILYRGLVDRDLLADDLAPARGRTLVLVSRLYDLSEAQVKVLRQFVADGGKLWVEHPDTKINFAPVAEELRLPADKAGCFDLKKPPVLAGSLCGSEGRLRGVRFTAFTDPAPKPKRIVLHALNYNVTLVGAKPGEVIPMSSLTLHVPVPEDWKKVAAKVYDPDKPTPEAVDCAVAEGTARINLPALRIYQMLELVGE